LAAAFEQLGERSLALGRVEDVVLLDAHPRQRAALVRDLVAQARQFLLARQQLLALDNPFVPGHDGMIHGVHGVLLDHDLVCFGRRTARTFPLGPPPA
jgi:hypothetical protein